MRKWELVVDLLDIILEKEQAFFTKNYKKLPPDWLIHKRKLIDKAKRVAEYIDSFLKEWYPCNEVSKQEEILIIYEMKKADLTNTIQVLFTFIYEEDYICYVARGQCRHCVYGRILGICWDKKSAFKYFTELLSQLYPPLI